MICGFVLAKRGEKISKSRSNSDMSPKKLIEEHSADVIRYWVANSRLGTDTFFSADELDISRRFVTKLWNAARFSISHLQDIDLDKGKVTMPVDIWIKERCRQTIINARRYLDQYEIGSARHEIDDFFWKDFCDYYLEIVKERLYQPEKHGHEERRSAQNALYYCMLNILKMYAVYVPHITEYIYQQFFKQHEKSISLHRLLWGSGTSADETMIRFGEQLKDVIGKIRKYKTESNLSMKAEIDEIRIDADPGTAELFRQSVGDIKACCSVRNVIIKCE